MNSKLITFSRKSAPEKSARMVETIVGCKWSLTVYNLLNNDINRPGEMVRSVEGLTTKVSVPYTHLTLPTNREG